MIEAVAAKEAVGGVSKAMAKIDKRALKDIGEKKTKDNSLTKNIDKRAEKIDNRAEKKVDSLNHTNVDKRAEKIESVEALKEDYINDVIANSDFPDTINKDAELAKTYEKRPPEENALKREEFQKNKKNLIEEWEKINGKEWPTYKEDVYDENGNLIRKAGMRYDAHHIQPLSMGGENVASNITPLSAEVHTDHKGVHKIGSPYNNLEKKLGA